MAYISGCQLNVLSSPTKLVQAIRFSHDLVAIAADDGSGKLAVADGRNVWILEPISEGWTRLWWETTLNLRRGDGEDAAQCLSWGNEGEVLVGGRIALSLFSTLSSSRTSSLPESVGGEDVAAEPRTALWEKRVASPIFQAAFSPSSSIIATRACYDRLVKIWRRLSFEEGLFDHTYLPHPGTVTHLQWRPLDVNAEERRGSGISGRHEDEPEVLYTIANDGILRVWRAGGMHDLDILMLHTTIDMVGAIPQSPTMTANGSQSHASPRYALIIPSDHFCAALNASIGLPHDGKVSHSKELLKEMVSQEPDVVVAFDGQGRMSAWGLQSVGHKRRPATPAAPQWFHITHSEGLQLRFPPNTPAICGSWFQDDQFHMLSHTLHQGGELAWWSGDVETFFSPSASGYTRISPTVAWNGHASSVLDLHPHSKGMVSWSADAVTLWDSDANNALKTRASLVAGSKVLAVATMMSKGLVLTITATEFAVWDQDGSKIGQTSCQVQGIGRIHVNLPEQRSESGVFVSDDASSIMGWSLSLSEPACGSGQAAVSLRLTSLGGQKALENSAFAVPVSMPFDPSHSCIIAMSRYGRLTCVPGSGDTIDEPIAVFETGIADPSLFAATEEFASVVSHDGNDLTIVDLTDGYLEHQQILASRATHLEAFNPKSRHNFLAVGHDTTIDLLAQGRYEHHSAGLPVWVMVKSISITGSGLNVSALAWMPKGSLVIAAGNSLLITSADVEPQHLDVETREANDLDSDIHLAELAMQLKSPLPAWHPSLLSHLIHHGHFGLVSTILAKLSQQLKFWGTGEELHPTLDEPLESIIREPDHSSPWLSDEDVHDLKEQLHEKDLPALSNAEQRRLLHVVEAIDYLREHVKELDRHAQRYLFNWKLQLLYSQDTPTKLGLPQTNGTASLPEFVPEIPWREVAFAQHSTTQQALLDILLLHHDNKLTWPIARRLCLTSWLADREALEQVFEQMAQSSYRSESPPDPVNASLYFLALKKKPTLLALWRIATWHKEQRTTTNFLKRDFAQGDAKTAARKNAYALMGKRRFHYSAAFFLLADDPSSAVGVLAGQCEDPQFAIAVARLYCGDGSVVLRKLLEDRVVPQAKAEGNRWLLSWCHNILLEKSSAANVLVEPLDIAVPKTWQQDDPSTLLLYGGLRGNAPSEHEYDAVLRAARILRRMGLWLLALDLVSRWEFLAVSSTRSAKLPHPTANTIANGMRELEISEEETVEAKPSGPPSLLDDFTSKPAAPKVEPPSLLDSFTPSETSKPDIQDEKAAREAKAAEMLKKLKAKKDAAAAPTGESEKKKPEPTQFKEPDANSLLDSFGF